MANYEFKGAPVGNKNAYKGRPWQEALRRALEVHKPAERRAKLDKLAQSLVDKAMDGDMEAIKEIGNRLDGRPAQPVVGGDEGESNPVAIIERVIVKPKD